MATRALVLLAILTLVPTVRASAEVRDVESLKGVTALKVVAEYQPSPGTPSYLELTHEQLRAAVEVRLRDAGLSIRELESPLLRIHIVSGGNDHGLTMYGVEIDFMKRTPGGGTALSEAWQLHLWGVVDNREMQHMVQKDLDKGLDELIADWLSVNPRASQEQRLRR